MSGIQVSDIEKALATADDKRLVKLVAAIDRLPSRGAFNRAMDPLRPRLAKLRPPRPLTLGRVLTLPIEALLVPIEAWQLGSTKIPRGHLGPLHAALLGAVDPALITALTEESRSANMNSGELVLAIGRRLWSACAEVADQAIRSFSGGPDAAGVKISLRLTGRLLAVAEPLVDVLWHMPRKPVIELDEETLERVRNLMGAAAGLGRDALEHILDLLVALTDNPQLVLDTLLRNDQVARGRDRDMSAAMLFERSLAKAEAAVRRLATDEDIEAHELAELVISTTSTIQALDSASKDIRYDRRTFIRMKTEAVTLVEARIGRLVEEILLAGLVHLPDEPQPEILVRRLERTARTTAQIRLASRPIGLATKLDYKMKSYFERFRTIAHNTVAPLDFMDNVRIIEILYSSAPAMQVYRERRKVDAPAPPAVAKPGNGAPPQRANA